MRPFCIPGLLVFCSVFAGAPALCAGDSPDLNVVHRIRQEAFKKSKVMDHVFHMTDVYGPRLTRSPGLKEGAQWVVRTAEKWGLENVQLEPWGPFGRGWSTSHFSAHMIEPQYASLIGVPLAWTPGSDGIISGSPILAPLEWPAVLKERQRALDEFIAEYRGKLRGQIVLLRDPPDLKELERAPSVRLNNDQLSERSRAPEPIEPIDIDYADPVVPTDPDKRRRFIAHAPRYVFEKLRRDRNEILFGLNRFLVDEDVRLVIYPARRGDGGTVFPPRVGWHDTTADPPPSIALTTEHYNRLARLVEHDIPCRIEVEVRAQFHQEHEPVNIVAEIPGEKKPDELVIIGAHFDDVVYGTGATDNASGCAVMMETMRILKSLDLKMDRTVRMVLWTGEEQGLLGSKAYVETHFGNPQTMELEPAHTKVSAYYNLALSGFLNGETIE